MHAALKKTIGIGAAVGLLASSTAGIAATSVPTQASYQAPNAWVMLTALSPSDSTVLGSAEGAAQPADVPPPPGPPPPPVVAGPGIAMGEVLPIALWFGLIAVALTVSDDGGRTNAIGNPNSPA